MKYTKCKTIDETYANKPQNMTLKKKKQTNTNESLNMINIFMKLGYQNLSSLPCRVGLGTKDYNKNLNTT